MLHLVINLDRSPDRWECINSQFQSINVDVQRISAFDAKNEKIPLEKIAPLDSPEKYFFPRQLTPNEIGCYLSHIKCWEALLASEEQWAVVLEDDALLSAHAKDFILSAAWVPPDIHIVQLQTYLKQWKCRTLPKRIDVIGNAHLYNVIEPSFGTCCYMVDREAAKVALDLSKFLAGPVDEFLFNFKSPFTQRFPTIRLNPACVLHNDNVQSTLGESRFSKKQKFSLRNHLSPKRLYLSTKKNLLKRFFCVNTVFTWE